MDVRRLDQCSDLLAAGTRRGLLALMAALLGGLGVTAGHESAEATEHPRHPGHKLRHRSAHHRRKHRHEQQLDDQEERQDDQDERQDERQEDRQDDQGGGLGNGPDDVCGHTLERAGCSYQEQNNRWVCPNGADIYAAATGPLFSCDYSNAILDGALLDELGLSYANFSGASLRNAKLSESHLNDAILIGTDLSGADLTMTDLTRADLTRANLTGTTMYYTDLTSVIWDLTTCPDGILSNDNGGTCCGNLNGGFSNSC